MSFSTFFKLIYYSVYGYSSLFINGARNRANSLFDTKEDKITGFVLAVILLLIINH